MQECSDPVGRFGIMPLAGCHWNYFKMWPDNFAITHGIVEPANDKGGTVLQTIQSIDRVGLRGQIAHVDGWQRWLPTITLKEALWITEVVDV